MSISKNKYIYFLFVILLLLFLKIDFRLQNEVFCCSDDSDYFMHTETMVEDFDFDYRNQLKGYELARYSNNKIAPLAFPGSSILASPFMFLGILIDRTFEFFLLDLGIVNFKLFFYSMSSVIYFLLSILLLSKTLKVLNISFSPIDILILSFGTGISYYAFERYSMSHVYEMFASSLIIYLSSIFYKNKKTNFLLTVTLPFVLFTGFYIRWINYYFFIIPIIVKKLFFSSSNRSLYKNINFLISSFISLAFYLTISKNIYGFYTLNAAKIYGSNLATDFIENTAIDINYLFTLLKKLIIIFTTQEFGIVFFQTIIFISFMTSLFNFLFELFINKKFVSKSFLVLISFSQIFFIAVSWGGTGSAFGWRYLMSLTPLAIVYYYYSFQNYSKFKTLHMIVLSLSVFSMLSTIFFETTEKTQLSLVRTENSFGNFAYYVERNFLTGYLESFTSIEAYYKIFITSFLGLIFLKLLISIFSIEIIFNFFENYGLPVNNEKVIQLFYNVENISTIYYIVTFSFISLLAYFFLRNLIFKNNY